jgi:hypothetical protein
METVSQNRILSESAFKRQRNQLETEAFEME